MSSNEPPKGTFEYDVWELEKSLQALRQEVLKAVAELPFIQWILRRILKWPSA